MSKFSLVVIVLFIISFSFLWFGQLKFDEARLSIFNLDQTQHQNIDVYVAKTQRQLYRGLGKREQLDKDGMLLVFGKQEKHGIVMRDMLFDIDIIWIDKGEVVDVATSISPQKDGEKLIPYFPRAKANLVLELPAGKADEYGITIGTKISLAKNN